MWALEFELSNLYKDRHKVMHVIIPVLQSWRKEDSWSTQSIHSSLMDDSQIPRRDYLKDKAVGIEKQLLRLPASFHKQGHTCTHEHITIHMVTQKHINTHTQKKEYKYCLLVRILWNWTPFYCCWKCRNDQLLWILLKLFL